MAKPRHQVLFGAAVLVALLAAFALRGSTSAQTPFPPPPPPYPPVFGAPAAPFNVQPSAVFSTSVTFIWSPGSANVAGYWVYAPNANPPEQAVYTTSFTLTNLAPGGTYCVTVMAFNAAGFSPWSSWGCATTPSAAASACPVGYVPGEEGCVPPAPPFPAFPGAGGCTDNCQSSAPPPGPRCGVNGYKPQTDDCLPPGTVPPTCPPGEVVVPGSTTCSVQYP